MLLVLGSVFGQFRVIRGPLIEAGDNRGAILLSPQPEMLGLVHQALGELVLRQRLPDLFRLGHLI